MTNKELITKLEGDGELDPNCRMCKEIFYPYYENLKPDEFIVAPFAPRHKAMITCRSGKHPHCTCDTCF